MTLEAKAVPTRTVELVTSELPTCINALPRLLTENLMIYVSGTLIEPLALKNFYGPGNIYTRDTGEKTFLIHG